ncbi:long-chain-fatty-acid--CoA ligase [mine drainage metagenome]|uniref:Long-chain-fatty-acid--CoA ligase n=1 Tax=mine drainage metagenome TaxID=410659 RepID=A0A1J5QJ95_9ZZZZ
MDVGRLVARSMRRYRNEVALIGPEGVMTYGQVGSRIMQLARALRSLGAETGDRILDLQSNQLTYVETDLAISTAGLCRVALNYRLHPTDWVRIAADCQAKVLIIDVKFWDKAVDVRQMVDHIIVINGDADGATPYEQFLAEQPTEPLLLSVDPDALVSLNYSSGTTGAPKGAIRTHRNRMASLHNIVTDFLGRVPTPHDTWVHAGPITHTSGLFVLPYFTFGAKQIVQAKFDPDELVDAIENRGANATALVPTMVARLLAMPDISPERVRNLEILGYAGAPMPPEQIRQCYERLTKNMAQYYGLVEAIPPVTVLSAEDHRRGIFENPELLSSAGTPCNGVEIRIVDEAGIDVPAGEIGEVITRGDHVMRGYYGLAAQDATATKAVRDGWLYTGDLGRLDLDDRLFLVDRKGDMIISGGYNIYPREIEDVIAEVPGVHEVAVVGVKDSDWGQHVTALFTILPGAEVSVESILMHCANRMASYKKPKDVRLVESFPLNSTGKIAKKVLREDLDAEVGK